MSILSPLRSVVGALTSEDSPRQLALGFALGMLVGIVPKGNLLAVLLLFLLMASKVNLATGMLAAFSFTWVGYLIDPISHRLGHWLLTHHSLRDFWTWVYNLPLIPWTNFNNTIVLGSSLIGLILFYPVYRLGLPYWGRISKSISERLKKYRVGQVLFGVDLVGKGGL